MRPMNPALARRLASFVGVPQRIGASAGAPTVLAPHLIKVADPVEDVELVLDALQGTQVATAHPWSVAYLARRGKLAPGSSVASRPCCFEEAERVHRNLAHLVLPHDFSCPTCRASYRLEMRATAGGSRG